MEALEEKLGYRFTNRALLENALTHSSYANENKAKGLQSNERLEFLGDSVLGMVVADYLFRTHPDLPEGDLTRTRAALVCEGSLVEVAQCLELGAYLKLGKGEEAGGGRERPSIIADAVEAVLAAVYLDGGIGSARKLIQKFILDREAEKSASRDYKTALQELVQRESGQVLGYRLIGAEGPDHAKIFSVEVDLNGIPIGQGRGRSKKEAEQNAAKAAIEKLKAGEYPAAPPLLRAEASRRVSGVKHFAEQNLDAGRIHSARTDGEKRGPQTACGGLGGGAERGQGRDREAEGGGITGPRATTRVAPTCRGCPAPL